MRSLRRIRYSRCMGAHTSARAASTPHTRAVLDAIRIIVQSLRESSRAAEKHVGLSGAQLFVLRAVADIPGLSLNELADRTRTHQSTVSVIVAGLADRGLLARSAAAADARRVELRLSAAGRRRLQRAPHAAQERLIAAVDALPAAQRAQLATLLGAVVQRMAAHRQRPTMFFEDRSHRSTRERQTHA